MYLSVGRRARANATQWCDTRWQWWLHVSSHHYCAHRRWHTITHSHTTTKNKEWKLKKKKRNPRARVRIVMCTSVLSIQMRIFKAASGRQTTKVGERKSQFVCVTTDCYGNKSRCFRTWCGSIHTANVRRIYRIRCKYLYICFMRGYRQPQQPRSKRKIKIVGQEHFAGAKKNVIHDDTRRVPYSPSTPPLPPHTQHAKCIEVDFEIRCDMISLFCSLLSPVPLRHPSDIWLWIVIFASLFTFPAHCCAIRFSNCTCFAMPRLGPIDWQLPIAVAKNENEHTTGWRKCFECRKITRAQIGFVPQSNGIRHIFIFIPNFATPILEQTKINRFPLWDRERDERRKRIGLSFLSAIRLHCSNRHVFLLAASTYPRLMFAPMRWIQLLFAFQY